MGGSDDTIATLLETLSNRPPPRPKPPPPPTGKPLKTATAAAPKQREMPVNPPSAPSKELHVFPNPAPTRDYVIQFQVPEFTCHCPRTGQPDFAHFTIDMIADKLCIEL